MLKFVCTILIILSYKLISSQPLNPSIEFSGISLEWKYKLSDTTFAARYVSGLISDADHGDIYQSPIEIDNKIYLIYNNSNAKGFGNLLNCYDINTGIILWSKFYNPLTTDGYSYNYYLNLKVVDNNNLELNGIRSINNIQSPFPKPTNIGKFSKRIINYENGEDLYNYTNLKAEFYSEIHSNELHQIRDSDQEMFYVSLYRNNDVIIYPMYLNTENDTIIDTHTTDTVKNISFYPINSNGSSNYVFIEGPFMNDAKTLFTYKAQHLIDTISKHFFWQTDAIGNIIYKKDVSEDLNGAKNDTYIQNINQSKDKIIAILRTPDGTYQDHRGYAILNLEGNVVKNKSQLTIEGKKVGHLSTIFLNNSEDLFHVIRFQENNNLFFYIEDNSGNFRKAGELINPNDSDLAFIPSHVLHTSDNGIVLTGEFLVASQKFLLGGWQVIMKISGESLGLTTSTKEATELISFNISPNPSTTFITINSEISYDEVLLYDLSGKVVLKNKKNGQLDISELPNATYLCELRKDGKSVSKGVKFVKVE